jgi:hypothetical protein
MLHEMGDFQIFPAAPEEYTVKMCNIFTVYSSGAAGEYTVNMLHIILKQVYSIMISIGQ